MLKKILVVLLLVTLTLGVLAGCNKREVDKQTHDMFLEVLPGAKNFSKLDTSNKNIPSTVEEAYYDTNGAGFVIKVVTKGYNDGLTILVGISSHGLVTGAMCLSSNESYGAEKNYGTNFIGKDKFGVAMVDLVAGATLTTKAYRDAVVDAINAVSILEGGEVDNRTPEQILLDNLREALPEAFSNGVVNYSDAFTEGYIVLSDGNINTASDFGADALHKAINGAGYVVEYNNEFVSVNDYYASDASDKAKYIAENISSLITESGITKIDINEYKNSTDRTIKKLSMMSFLYTKLKATFIMTAFIWLRLLARATVLPPLL